MKIKVLFLKVLCFVSLTACGGAEIIRTHKTSGSLGEIRSFISGDQIKQMRYFLPIYSKPNPEYTKSRTLFHFVQATTKRLDSIFKVSAEKYRISGKIKKPNLRESHRMNSSIGLVFQEIDSNKNIQDIRIPAAICSVLKKHRSRFALAMLISPDFSTWEQTSPQAIELMRKQKKEHSYIVTPGTIQVLIFDLENNNIAFYRTISEVEYSEHSKGLLEDVLNRISSRYFSRRT